MNYEIRIISEEDTVKSKVYEDLDKAIEIADKIYNDFIDLDFGDEIVVCEENKKDKKYWANGKKLCTEIKIGDTVTIIDDGKAYTTYYDFMLQYGTKNSCLGWQYGKSPSTYSEYRVLTIADHIARPNEDKLAIIEEISGHSINKTYIIGLKGLRKI